MPRRARWPSWTIVLPDEQRQEVAWARRSLVATGMHRAALAELAPLLEKLRRAVRERRRVQMTLPRPKSAGGAPAGARPLRAGLPLGLVVRHRLLPPARAVRSFRVDRISELILLDETFDVAAGFDIQAYLATDMGFQPACGLRLRFAPQFAQVALDDRAAVGDGRTAA